MSAVLFLRHTSGANHALRGKRLAALRRELKAGRGGPEVTALVLNGYTETMGGVCVDGLTSELLELECTGALTELAARLA